MGTDRALHAAAKSYRPPARKFDLRKIVNPVASMASTGRQWLILPNGFPPVSTAQPQFYDWRDGGFRQTIRFIPANQGRERERRKAQPTERIIDSQTSQNQQAGGPQAVKSGQTAKQC